MLKLLKPALILASVALLVLAAIALAAVSSLWVLGATSGLIALKWLHADSLAACFGVWALVLCASPAVGMRQVALAAALLTLAFATKISAGYYLIAACLFLFFSGRKPQAFRLAAFTAAGFALFLISLELLTSGRASEILLASASGGATLRDFLKSPLTLLHRIHTMDPGVGPFFFLAAALLITLPRRLLSRLPVIFFLSAVVATIIIFIPPGTDFNHLLDLHIASLVLIAWWLSQAEPAAARLACAAAVLAAFLALIPLYRTIVDVDFAAYRDARRQTLEIIARTDGPILTENATVSVAARRHPYLMDPFLFHAFAETSPEFAEPLLRKVRNREFAVIVLMKDPNTEAGKESYSSIHFSNRFIAELNANYILSARLRGHYVYLPLQSLGTLPLHRPANPTLPSPPNPSPAPSRNSSL